MATADDQSEQTLFDSFLQNEEQIIFYMAYVYLAIGVLMLLSFRAGPYGRYGSSAHGILLNANMVWFLQMMPAFAVPLWCAYIDVNRLNVTNGILVGMVIVHYFHR